LSKLRRPLNVIHGNDRFIKFNRARGNSGYNGYSSRWFTLKREQNWPVEWWWKVVFLRMATPDHPYVLAFFPIENQRWLLSYIGVNKQYPPRREDEFAAALAKLASPVVHEMVERMEPISPIYSSRATRNRWRHYERWRRPLGRFYCARRRSLFFQSQVWSRDERRSDISQNI
jgi:hypothetical protein